MLVFRGRHIADKRFTFSPEIVPCVFTVTSKTVVAAVTLRWISDHHWPRGRISSLLRVAG